MQTKIGKLAVNQTSKPLHRVVEDKFISLLRTCGTCVRLHQIQAQIVTHGLEGNDYVTPSFITACARLGGIRQNGATKRRHVERHVPRVRPSQLPPRRRRFVRANAPRWRVPQLLHVPHGSEVLCHCERCERRTTGSLRCSQTRL